MTETSSKSAVLILLEDLFKADPEACRELLSFSVKVPETYQPDKVNVQKTKAGRQLSVLGLLNGVSRKTSNTSTALLIADDGLLLGFSDIKGA